MQHLTRCLVIFSLFFGLFLIHGTHAWAQQKNQPKTMKWNDVADRWDLKTNNGEFSGHVKKNYLFEDRYDEYDRDGRFVGTWHRNEISDRWEFHER